MDETGLSYQDLIGRRIEFVEKSTDKCICRGICRRLNESSTHGQNVCYVTVDNKRYIYSGSPKVVMRLSDRSDVSYTEWNLDVYKWDSESNVHGIFSKKLPDVILDTDNTFSECDLTKVINPPSLSDWAEITDNQTGEIVARGKIIAMKCCDNIHFDMDLISIDGKWFFNTKSRFEAHYSNNYTPLEFTSADKYDWCKWIDSSQCEIHDLYRENGYDELDPEVEGLVHELNEWDGIETVVSCCGHGQGHLWVTFNVSNLHSLQTILNCLRTPEQAPELVGKFHIPLDDERVRYGQNGIKLTPGANHTGIFGDVKMTDGTNSMMFMLATNDIGEKAYEAATNLANFLRKLRLMHK